MTQANSKAHEKRIARMTAFMQACGVEPKRVFAFSPRQLHAFIGDQSRDLHKFLRKNGWIKVERINYGGGEVGKTYRHPELSTGGLEIIEYRGNPVHNKVCVWP